MIDTLKFLAVKFELSTGALMLSIVVMLVP